MPCNMYDGATSGDFARGEAQDAMRRANEAMAAANKVTDMLCRLMRALSPEQILTLDPDLQKWFLEHLKHDAARGRP